jgi:predicted metalloprotease with PDZ domain
MTLGRAGIIDRPTLLVNTARTLRSVNESPGRKERSARMASFDAPFFDGAATPNLTNAPATFVSYYTRGQVLSMALDLMIRAKTSNERSLDDVLRRLKQLSWDTPNASYYLQGRGYTEADVERAASDVMGENMHPWFERHVGGVEDPDWVSLFAGAGLRLQIGGPSREYTLTEMPDATAAQAKAREGWYTGRSGPKM